MSALKLILTLNNFSPTCTFYTPATGEILNSAPATDQATAVASVSGGIHTGVAKNVTIHSCKIVDVRPSCLFI